MKRLLAILLLLSATTVHAAPLPLRQTSGEVWIKLTHAGHNDGIGFVVCYTGQGAVPWPSQTYFDLPSDATILIGRYPATPEQRAGWRSPERTYLPKPYMGTILHRNGIVHAIHLEADK